MMFWRQKLSLHYKAVNVSRAKIEFPETVVFSTDIDIHSIYINRGNHVGNSHYVELCNETCQRFFKSRAVPEYRVGEQVLLNTEFFVQLKSEAKFSDVLTIELGVSNYHRCGCDFIFRLTHKDQTSEGKNKVVALASFSFLSFDYKLGKVVEAADSFKAFFTDAG